MNARALLRPTLRHVRAPVGGALLAMSAPPFPVAFLPLAVVGLALFADALADAPTHMRAVGRGWLFGMAVNVIVFSFVVGTIERFTDLPHVVALVALLLLAAAQALAFSFFAIVVSIARRFAVPTVLSFTLGAAALPLFPGVFAWTMAVPVARVPMLAQLAEMFGERGIAVLLALVAALVATGMRDAARRAVTLGVACAVPLVACGYGALRIASTESTRERAPHRRVGLVQHAVGPIERWDARNAPRIVERLWMQTRQSEASGATLTVLAEAAYPYLLPHQRARDGENGPSIRGPYARFDVISGLVTRAGTTPEGGVDTYNATAIAHAGGAIDLPTAKIELLAFGESVPFGEQSAWLRRTFARAGSTRPGRDIVLLTSEAPTPPIRAGILNCFEDTLPAFARRIANAGPNLLVNVTNDAWFGQSAEPELHLAAATMRAIETRRDMVRAVNTGVTAHVDAAGRIVARAPRGERTVLVSDVALLESKTPWMYLGDVSYALPLAIVLALALVRARRVRR